VIERNYTVKKDKKKRLVWVRKWNQIINQSGASRTVVKYLASEDREVHNIIYYLWWGRKYRKSGLFQEVSAQV
jgi:hypothetical protein